MSNNTVNNKRIAKNTIMLYIRQLFVLAIGLYTPRLALEVLSETDFGIYAARLSQHTGAKIAARGFCLKDKYMALYYSAKNSLFR